MSLKTNKRGKLELLFLRRLVGTDSLTGEQDTRELASNLYQFSLGSDQPMLSHKLEAECHTDVSVLKAKTKTCYAFFFFSLFPPMGLQWSLLSGFVSVLLDWQYPGRCHCSCPVHCNSLVYQGFFRTFIPLFFSGVITVCQCTTVMTSCWAYMSEVLSVSLWGRCKGENFR